MSEAKIRSLLVRPIQSADLAFTVAGVLDWENDKLARLGASVTEYSLENSLYTNFEGPNKPAGTNVQGSSEIVQALTGATGPAVFALRNHVLRADLDEAIKRQANAILQRYAHITQIAQAYALLYPAITDLTKWPPSVTDSVADWTNVTSTAPLSALGRVQAMSAALGARFENLKTAYGTEAVLTKVKSTSTPEGKVISSTDANGYPTFSEQHHDVQPGKTTIKDKAGAPYQTIEYEKTTSDPKNEDAELWKDWGTKPKKMQTTTTDYATANAYKSVTDNDLAAYSYRPSENTTAFLRAQLDLLQQSIQEFINSLSVSKIKDVMNNERTVIDLGVRRIQINLALTYLVPPFSGLVTSVYKDRGDSVAAGEPVIRIEDDKRLYLVGTVNYRGLLSVTPPPADGNLTVVTKSLFEDAREGKIEKVAIRSIRGHDADNDEWDVVLECENSVSVGGNKIKLPLNYHFDPDDTIIMIP